MTKFSNILDRIELVILALAGIAFAAMITYAAIVTFNGHCL